MNKIFKGIRYSSHQIWLPSRRSVFHILPPSGQSENYSLPPPLMINFHTRGKELLCVHVGGILFILFIGDAPATVPGA